MIMEPMNWSVRSRPARPGQGGSGSLRDENGRRPPLGALSTLSLIELTPRQLSKLLRRDPLRKMWTSPPGFYSLLFFPP